MSSKNVRKFNFSQLEEALLNCIREYEAKSPGLIITDDILKEKATDFADKLGFSNFNASNGFISRYKNWNLLSYDLLSGESRVKKE